MVGFEDLQTFVEVADAGGLTRAAQRMGLAKSIVSRRLMRLEKTLGVQLLARNTRGAALTEAGATLREHAARVVVEVQAAFDAISPTDEIWGRLRVAAPLSGVTHLAPVMADLARRYPRLEVQTSYTDHMVDLVSDGFDVAIRAGYLEDSSLVARRIAPLHAKVVASPAYLAQHGMPASPADLVDHEALTTGADSWRFNVKGETLIIHPTGRFKANHGQALLSAALEGLGIAMLPDFLTTPLIASGALVQVLADYPTPDAGLYVVRLPGAQPPRKIKALTNILLEYFAPNPELAAKIQPRG